MADARLRVFQATVGTAALHQRSETSGCIIYSVIQACIIQCCIIQHSHRKFVYQNTMFWHKIRSLILKGISLHILSPVISARSLFDLPASITPPARRAWRSYKFAPFLFFFLSHVESRRTAHG